MGDPSTPAPDIGVMRMTRFERYTAYLVYQFDVLIAIVNAHYDLVLVPPRKKGAKRYTVSSIKRGRDSINVHRFVRWRVEERIAEKRKTMEQEKFWQLWRAETYAETRHLLEDIAFIHGVLCIDRPAKGRVEYPSIDTISGPGFLLGRSEIMTRGYFIHSLLKTLCGGRRMFCVPRGNGFLRAMLTAPDCNIVLQHARNAIAAERFKTAQALHVSRGSTHWAQCGFPGDTVACGTSGRPKDVGV